ncbi:MAG: NAD-dependent epimerase/dehydratase family protein, partial [Bacteroidota bacterium]
MKTILIAGGSGLVGSRLSQLLAEQKYEVRHLSRRPSSKSEFPTFVWDLEKNYIDPKALEEVDAVINLAGAGIADRLWSDARKKLIIDSRVQSTQLLARKIQEGLLSPSVYLSASAIGYYGHRGDQWVEETDQPGEGFL